MPKSKNKCLEDNDFLEAVERLNNTTPRWKKEWFTVCESIFNRCNERANQYILDTANYAVRKLTELQQVLPKVKKTDISMTDNCVIESNEDRVQKCYLIEFFDENNTSICSKVGTTIRTIQERIREELNSKTYKNMGACRCVIHRVYNCGAIPAEGLESYFRSQYIKRYPNSFYKNDRFIKETFDLVEADKIAKSYLE